MCGIVGLFLKDKLLEPKLGMMLTEMLITMSDRGPDSAGIAIYKTPSNSFTKITIQSSVPHIDFENIKVVENVDEVIRILKPSIDKFYSDKK